MYNLQDRYFCHESIKYVPDYISNSSTQYLQTPSSEMEVWKRGEAGNLSASFSHVIFGWGKPITWQDKTSWSSSITKRSGKGRRITSQCMIRKSSCQSIYLSICLVVCLSVCLAHYLSVSLLTYISIYLLLLLM